MKWFIKVFRHYADFSGRARRKEYWMFVLFNFIFLFAWTLVATFAVTFARTGSVKGNELANVMSIVYLCYILVMFLPGMAVAVRRLHDLGKSGWWLLIMLIPFGGIWLFILMVTEGQRGDNRYGPDPKTSEEIFDIRAKLKSAGVTLTLVCATMLIFERYLLMSNYDYIYHLYGLFRFDLFALFGWIALLAAGFFLLSREYNGSMQGKERIVLYLPMAATALFVLIDVLNLVNADEFVVIRLIISLISNLSILLFFVLLLFVARNSELIRITAIVALIFLIIRLLCTVYFANLNLNLQELMHLLMPVAFIVLIRTLTSVYTRQDTNSEYKY
jgi:uncharacterized membrane protein YhaH (DUF805 family)